MAKTEMIKYLLEANQALAKRTIDDISEEDSMVRGSDGLNHIRWQTGHLLWGEVNTAALLGGEPEDDTALKQMFGSGSELSDDPAHYPSMSELREQLYDVQRKAVELAESVSEDDLGKPAEGDNVPRWRRLTFMLTHQFYHAGMIVNVRKILGRERLFG